MTFALGCCGRLRVFSLKSLIAISLLTPVLAAPIDVRAQGMTVIYKSLPSADELAKELFGKEMPKPEGTTTLRTRGIQGHGEPERVDAEPAPPADVELHWAANGAGAVGTRSNEPVKKLAFNIQFVFDSTEILGESQSYIDRLGEVLSQIKDTELVIVGHTDASGSDGYNQNLSIARASAVREYLLSRWQIAPGRLTVDGRGESELLSTIDPLDPTHRRVEFWAPNTG